MISSIHIEGFRGFERFDMDELAPVNLLVGANNSGKTSLLEALHLLTSRADPRALWQILWRRGENGIERTRPSGRVYPEVDTSHLFTGHQLHVETAFTLSAMNQTPRQHLKVEVADLTDKESDLFSSPGENIPQLGLRLKGAPSPIADLIPLSSTGALSAESLDTPRRLRRGGARDHVSRVRYITTDAMDAEELVEMWNVIALTADEELVLTALACIDPGIERIVALSTPYRRDWAGSAGRTGFIVKHSRFENPVPIGSMGDGIWRLFSLAIAITQCRGGVLLVDEIDTGLHFSAMSDMWKLIVKTARIFEVQVFATTHNYDCLNSLASNASASSRDEYPGPAISVQRIERDKNRAVSYTEEEIKKAIQHFVEIR